MPTVSPNAKILSTGSNGYIGMWIVNSLLGKGYSVRAVVRSADKGKHLLNHFKAYGDKLEIAVVPDMTKEGAFDEAVKDVEGVVHTASPVGVWNPKVTVEEFYEPAVKGTTGILKSVITAGANVKKVILTGSIAAVLEVGKEEKKTYTEKDWNEVSVKTVEEKGADAGAVVIYIASKTLAEKAAWEFYEKHKNGGKWGLSVLHPATVVGPSIQDIKSSDQLDGSMKAFWECLIPKEKKFMPMPGAWVDVRDLADAHVLALEKEESAGERLFINAGPLYWQDWVDAANKLDDSYLPGRKLTPAYPDPERKTVLDFSNANEQKILGVKYRSIEDTVRDSLKDFADRGFYKNMA